VELTIGSMRPDEEERRYALMRQAFDASVPFDPDAPLLPDERVVVARLGDDVVGSVMTLAFVQTWGAWQWRPRLAGTARPAGCSWSPSPAWPSAARW
jgi:hypothetical protein